jgi:hypothetical protein
MPNIKTNVSITFLGTNHHRDTHHSVLVSAHEQIDKLAKAPNSQVAAWLLDGPGSAGSTEHPVPGTYFYHQGKKIINHKLANEKLYKFKYALTQTYRKITGEGVESSILEASTYLDEIIEQNGGVVPTTINLQGFSRGADNCIRLANIIYLMYPDIKINLFLVDPVPGPWRRDDPESYHLPPNINNCQINLMLDEHHTAFKPQHSDRYSFSNPNTRVAFHYLPGRHGAGLATKEHADIYPALSQTLIQDSLLKFNIENGVLPQGATNPYWHVSANSKIYAKRMDKPVTPMTTQQRFDALCIAMKDHKKLAARAIVNFYSKRRIYRKREQYVLDSDLFIDGEHRELFKKLYPATFNWFFEKNRMPPTRKKPYSKEEVFHELQYLKPEPYSNFYNNFIVKFKMIAVNKIADIVEPQGIDRIEKAIQSQPLVTDELSYLQFCLRSIRNEYHYHVPSSWFKTWVCGSDVVVTKSKESDYIQREIKHALALTRHLPYDEAKSVLKKLILKIKTHPSQEFFYRQIQKIIPDSKHYVKSVLSVLKRYEDLLPPEYAALVAKTIRVIERQLEHPLYDDYQKRVNAQAYLMSLSTAIHQVNIQLSCKNILCEQLVGNINQLSRPSYAEPQILEDIIRDLEGYIRRRMFYSYFPLSKLLGFYNPDNINLTRNVVKQLNQLQNTKSDKSDFTQIEAVLKNASMQYTQIHRQDNRENKLIFWQKQLSFKADPLNKLIERHLTKVTKLSNLIFAMPKAPNQSWEDGDTPDFFVNRA